MSTESRFLTPRQRAREVAFQILYALEQAQELPEDTLSLSRASAQKYFQLHYDHFSKKNNIFELPGESKDFCERIILETLTQLKTIDSLIKKHALNWKFERLAATDKAFLRIGAAELLFFKDVPAKVTLEEIIELSKVYGEEETPKFVNGILDPISKDPVSLAGKIESHT